jgi:hypothetical protein
MEMSSITFTDVTIGGIGWAINSNGDVVSVPTPVPVGSNDNGHNLFIFAGNADGTGNAGTTVIKLPTGAQVLDPTTGYITGTLQLDGTNQDGFEMLPPHSYAAGPLHGMGQNLTIAAGDGDSQGGDLALNGGSATVAGAGGDVNITAGSGLGDDGGTVLLVGGASDTGSPGNVIGRAGNGTAGASVIFSAGTGSAGNGGSVQFNAGNDNGNVATGGAVQFMAASGLAGGAVVFAAGNGNGNGAGGINLTTGSDGTDGNGGDVTFTYGTGTGAGKRNGLLFPNLPTSNPGVSGAAWNNAGVVTISP